MGIGTFTGNRALLKIAGQLVGVGLTQNADFQDDLGVQKVSGLGKPTGVELVVGEVNYAVSLSKMFVFDQTLIDLGFVPEEKNYLTSPDLEIEILDNVSGKTMKHYTGGKTASYGMTVGKHTPSTENVRLIFLNKIV